MYIKVVLILPINMAWKLWQLTSLFTNYVTRLFLGHHKDNMRLHWTRNISSIKISPMYHMNRESFQQFTFVAHS